MYNTVTTQCSLHPDMSYVTGIKILLPNVLFVCFLGRGGENRGILQCNTDIEYAVQ